MATQELALRRQPGAALGTRGIRLIAVGGWLVVVATGINEVIAGSLRGWLQVPTSFQPLSVPAVATGTVAGMIAAIAAFAWVARVSSNPRRTFVRLAIVALVASLVPDALIWATGVFPSTTGAGVLSLAVLHLSSATLAVMALAGFGLTLGRGKR